MTWICFKCKKEHPDDLIERSGFKCDECGGKVFFEKRPTMAKQVRAR
jgi:DNA-directed RNA polymerase subunit RPC12/RpoP